MNERARRRLAYLLAPLAPTVAIFILVGGAPMVDRQPIALISVIYIASLLVMCVVAFPLLKLVFRKRRFLDFVLVGLITGLVVSFGLAVMSGKPISEMLIIEKALAAVLSISAVLGGIICWLVGYRKSN